MSAQHPPLGSSSSVPSQAVPIPSFFGFNPPTDHESKLFKGLRDLFGNDKYSDLTVVTSQERIKVHKVILAAGSDYFRTHWDLPESDCKILRRDKYPEDDPQATKGMLAHLYGIHFDKLEDCKDEANSIGKINNQTDLAIYQVALYIVADKYLMPDLAAHAKARLRALAAAIIKEDSDGFFKVAEVVYLKHKTAATALRCDIVGAMFRDPVTLKDVEKNKLRCANMPDLLCELVQALCEMQGVRDRPLLPVHPSRWGSCLDSNMV